MAEHGEVWHSIPAAILLPFAYFLSVFSPEAREPKALICLAYVGAVSLAVGSLILGVGMIRSCHAPCDTHGTARSERVGR
jgi:hypothetical protein